VSGQYCTVSQLLVIVYSCTHMCVLAATKYDTSVSGQYVSVRQYVSENFLTIETLIFSHHTLSHQIERDCNLRVRRETSLGYSRVDRRD
jgi:hypothetical protein